MSNILLHSLVFYPDGVSTAYLMTELAIELKRHGHSVTVLTTTPHYNVSKKILEDYPMQKHWFGLVCFGGIDGIPVWHIKIPKKGNRVWFRVFDYIRFHAISLLSALFKIRSQDVIIATSPPLTIALMSWLFGVYWKAPSVYKVAELYPDLAIRQGVVKNRCLIVFLNWLERFIYKKNTMIVPIAEQFNRVLKQRGVPDEKLRMIPDHVDTRFFSPCQRINKFSINNGLSDGFVVLYAGNIGIVQDWDSVLHAADVLSDLPIRFAIIGDGAKSEWLRKEVKARRLNNVLLLGYQPKEIMPMIYASCDISIIPMTMAGSKDGVPSKIYTILSCAKPVIAQVDNDSELRRIIERSGCGRTVPVGDTQAFSDAILKAFNESEALPAEGAKGRKYVEENYSKEAIADKYNRLIIELRKEDGRAA